MTFLLFLNGPFLVSAFLFIANSALISPTTYGKMNEVEGSRFLFFPMFLFGFAILQLLKS